MPIGDDAYPIAVFRSWDTTVRVWSLDGLAGGGGAVPHTRTLAGHGGGISAIATFPAGHEDLRMFSGSSDSTIKVCLTWA